MTRRNERDKEEAERESADRRQMMRDTHHMRDNGCEEDSRNRKKKTQVNMKNKEERDREGGQKGGTQKQPQACCAVHG